MTGRRWIGTSSFLGVCFLASVLPACGGASDTSTQAAQNLEEGALSGIWRGRVGGVVFQVSLDEAGNLEVADGTFHEVCRAPGKPVDSRAKTVSAREMQCESLAGDRANLSYPTLDFNASSSDGFRAAPLSPFRAALTAFGENQSVSLVRLPDLTFANAATYDAKSYASAKDQTPGLSVAFAGGDVQGELQVTFAKDGPALRGQLGVHEKSGPYRIWDGGSIDNPGAGAGGPKGAFAAADGKLTLDITGARVSSYDQGGRATSGAIHLAIDIAGLANRNTIACGLGSGCSTTAELRLEANGGAEQTLPVTVFVKNLFQPWPPR